MKQLKNVKGANLSPYFFISKMRAKKLLEGGKSLLRWLKKVLEVLGNLSVLVAGIALATTLYPQIIPRNNNYLAMANAGHIQSQIYLADYYYKTGQYTDALYWYGIAATQPGEYEGISNNNLGYLYAKGLGLSSDGEAEELQFQKAYFLFKRSFSLGQEIAKDNIIACTMNKSSEYFPNTDYKEISDFLIKYFYTGIKSETYKTFNSSHGVEFWDGNTHFTLCGKSTTDSEEISSETIWTYYGVEYNSKNDVPELKYIEPLL